MRYDGLFFDMDGTLWDACENIALSWQQTMQRDYGISPDALLSPDEIKPVMGLPMDEIAVRLFSRYTNDPHGMLAHCAQQQCDYLRLHGANLYPGVEQVLQQLGGKLPVFIVSNCQSGYIEAFLEHYGFGRYITDFDCFGNTGLPKSANIAQVAARNGVQCGVYVGDTLLDYTSTQQAGLAFIHAAYGFGAPIADVPRILSLPELLPLLS